jgi:hypothetical protein
MRRQSFRHGFAAVALTVGVTVLSAASRPAPLLDSTLSVTIAPFVAPDGATFSAGFITSTVSWTITSCAKSACVGTVAANSAVVEPPNAPGAITRVEISLNSGASWQTLTTTPVQFASVATSGSGSFLIRYDLGWVSGGGTYTPPGSYSLPVTFNMVQGAP